MQKAISEPWYVEPGYSFTENDLGPSYNEDDLVRMGLMSPEFAQVFKGNVSENYYEIVSID